jgi:amidase
MRDRYANVAFGQLHNLRLRVRREIDAALDQFDLLLTPTLPITAPALPDGDAPFAEVAERTSALLCYNTAPLNLTGHPAISHPSGSDARGLPTAVQLVGGNRRERVIFRAAFALEAALAR